MSLNFRKIYEGLRIFPKTSSTASVAGELDVISSTGKLQYHNGTTASPVVTEAHTATLTNKTLSGNTAANLISGSGTLVLPTSGTATIQNGTDTLIGRGSSDQGASRLVNKDLDDSSVRFVNVSDTSKHFYIDASSQTTGTNFTLKSANTATRNLTFANVGTDDTIPTNTSTSTLTNKTLSGNTAATLISGSGTLTLNTTGTITVPNATDTLVGKATTDILTNKTLTGNTAVNLISGSGTMVLNTSGTITVPSGTDTLVGKSTNDTLINKTMRYNVTSHSSDFTLSATADYAPVDGTTGVTATLPTAVGVSGKIYTIKKTDSTSSGVTISTTSSQTIDGLASFRLGRQYNSIKVVSDGSNWLIDSRDVDDFATAASSTKTPTASGNWQQFTGNSITLTAGTWVLYGKIIANSTGGDPAFSNIQGKWATANGDDTSSTPTSITVIAGDVLSQNNWVASLNTGSNNWPMDLNMPEVRVTIAAGDATAIYLDVLASMTTASQARLTAKLWANRIR